MLILTTLEHLGSQAERDAMLLAADQELIQRTVLLALIPVIVAFVFIVFVFYRSRREAQFRQKETEFRLSLAEGELKALRAQIDPHFVFNCLNSIHHFMFSNDATRAGDYLIKFSRLIRHVLESSALRSVSLAEEIEANRAYIEIEQLRMNQTLTFQIDVEADINLDQVEVPPMMIQPFVENAIWHGLPGGGNLELHFSMAPHEHIQCVIKDQGKESGPHASTNLSGAVKKSSMGMALMRDRFEMINRLHGTQASFTLTDRTDGVAGKQMTVLIPVM